MSAAILDRARAFAAIAEYLPEQEREEIAKAIGDRIRRECTPAKAAGTHAAPTPLVEPESIPENPEVSFLRGKGVEPGPDLVRMTGQLAKFLSTDAYKHLSADARRQTWWAMRSEDKA